MLSIEKHCLKWSLTHSISKQFDNIIVYADYLILSDCGILYLLDMAQTSKSFTRQSKLDVLKRY